MPENLIYVKQGRDDKFKSEDPAKILYLSDNYIVVYAHRNKWSLYGYCSSGEIRQMHTWYTQVVIVFESEIN